MLRQKIVVILITLGFLLASSGVAVAQMLHQMPAAAEETTQFRRIEQPLWLKAGVTFGGMALIGLELWWFLFSKTKAQHAEASQGIQED